MKQIVYVLINGAIPNLVKIGKTRSDVKAKTNELYSINILYKLECAYAVQPTKYWLSDGKNLRDIWRETYYVMNEIKMELSESYIELNTLEYKGYEIYDC